MDPSMENFAEEEFHDGAGENENENENMDNQEQQDDDVEAAVGGENAEKRWPGWPGDSVFRILVPSQKVGSIIGRKGDIIKKMCEESKARIKILDGPQGALVRAVIISAKEEQDASISPAMDGLLRVHKRIVDGLDGEMTNAPPNGGQTLPTRLLVPATQAGTLIGKQGATIKSIQEASKSIVRILEELPPVALQDDRVVEIQGEPTAMHKALELIASHLRKFLVDRSVLSLFEVPASMQHPPHMEHHMHHNMPPPQPWEHAHHPPPPNAGGGPGYGNNSQFMHPRPHDNFYPTPEFPAEKPPHYGISTYGRDAPPMGGYPYSNQQPPMSSQVSTQHMQIPLSYADAVIGAAGSNISYIRRTSGAAITIQESRGAPGEMTVEINGSGTQIQTAQQLIQNYMAGAAAAAAAPQAPGQGSNSMAPSDQGYGYASHGPPYASQGNAGSAAHNGGGYASGGGYGSSYGTSYGY